MAADHSEVGGAILGGLPGRKGLCRFVRSRDGAAAIEFALLAIPYFMIIFAILETFVAFAAEQLVSNAVDTMGRKLRIGQITAANTTGEQFRKAFCDEISILITCSESELATPSKLYLDVETYSKFSDVPTTIPRLNPSDPFSDLKTSDFKFVPGGKGTINMVRAYYRWQIITDLIRPYITNIRPADGSMPTDFLIVATSVFQNEQFP